MWLQKNWYTAQAGCNLLLLPLEWLFCRLASYRKSRQEKQQWRAPCPLIIVGNISIGGTGKSPLTIELIGILQSKGFKVGVVSRGYGAVRTDFPYQVLAADSAEQSPDEPLMIVRRTGVNLVIDPNRVRACQYLLANNECDLIISDDGLQHYVLGRDIEIAVIDGARGLGNGHCLPVGPLRESAQRLLDVDYVVVNGESSVDYPHQTQMLLEPIGWYRVGDDHFISLDEFRVLSSGVEIHALAGIGNPQRFFTTLKQLGLEISEHVFVDHHQYSSSDFDFLSPAAESILCMTEKDAVKCKNIAPPGSYYLKIAAKLDSKFIDDLTESIHSAAQR